MKNKNITDKLIMICQCDDEFIVNLGGFSKGAKNFSIENLTDVLILVCGYFSGDLNEDEL